MQIKLFVRPGGLKPLREQAAQRLVFIRKGERLDIRNPTPYFLTLTDLKAGTKPLSDVMVPPLESVCVDLPPGSGGTLFWNAIGDHGEMDAGKGTIH